MPRFFYHFQSGPCRLLDTEGLECRTVAEAVAHAYVLVLKTSHASALPGSLHRSIEVTDQAGSMRFRLPFSSVVIDLSQPSRRTGHDKQMGTLANMMLNSGKERSGVPNRLTGGRNGV